jgi:hypothetical protein
VCGQAESCPLEAKALKLSKSRKLKCISQWKNGAGGHVGACTCAGGTCHGNCCTATGVCPTSSCIANGLGTAELNCPRSANCPVPASATCNKAAYNSTCTGKFFYCHCFCHYL